MYVLSESEFPIHIFRVFSSAQFGKLKRLEELEDGWHGRQSKKMNLGSLRMLNDYCKTITPSSKIYLDMNPMGTMVVEWTNPDESKQQVSFICNDERNYVFSLLSKKVGHGHWHQDPLIEHPPGDPSIPKPPQ